jgi:Uma2 family endonuclease
VGGGRVATDLMLTLTQFVRRRAVKRECARFAVFREDDDYRLPDVVVARGEDLSKRGAESADLVVEVLSRGDESRDKFPCSSCATALTSPLSDRQRR